ncbi:nucleotide exchange factor GrpE [Polycladomyces sp. WAk]|uniref:Nucleotide exchange factor GrpE n=1 Tax=Polycladomyces zharkentensis TaxID=2807616 RepID=A0ABS2WMC5_9BACL|nr:nucleotide exchange factor GrpE [Polycladomyces sp. WAk]
MKDKQRTGKHWFWQENRSAGKTESDQHTLQQLLASLTHLNKEFSSLNHIIEKRIRYDKTKEEAFDRLYAELEELKQDAAFRQNKPLYIDLILLFDRLDNMSREIDTDSEVGRTFARLLDTLRDEVLEILYRREVQLLRTGSDVFDPRLQHAIGVEPTDDPAENNRVARVVRHGFLYRDTVLRPEEVIVKRYRSSSMSLVER